MLQQEKVRACLNDKNVKEMLPQRLLKVVMKENKLLKHLKVHTNEVDGHNTGKALWS